LHDLKPRFGAHGGEHIGVLYDIPGFLVDRGGRHDSMIAEIR
jgi:hypothetical protein